LAAALLDSLAIVHKPRKSLGHFHTAIRTSAAAREHC
jgi:hypothetical protein